MRQRFAFPRIVLLISFVLVFGPFAELGLVAQEISCRTRLVPTFVTDRDGTTLRNLSSSDFQLQSHEIPASIVSWAPDQRPHRVVILLDVSKSMKGLTGPSLWNSAMLIAQHVASIQSDNVHFSLIVFAGQVLQTIDFSQGNDAVRRAIDNISKDPAFASRQDKPGTAIFDALKAGFQQLDSPTSADSLLLITDAFDEGSKANPEQLLTILSVPMVRVFCIQMVDPVARLSTLGPAADPTTGPVLGLVQKSGGRVFGPVDPTKTGFTNSPDSAELRNSIGRQLVEFYRGILQNDLLTIQLSSDPPKDEPLRLSLSDSAQRQYKHAHLFYPHEIPACPAAAASKPNSDP